MDKTIPGHKPRVTRMIALLAVLLLLLAVTLAFALQPAPTTSDRDASPANQAMSAEDPYVERHAEVIERLGDGSLR
jgi:hypothetical protein